MANRPPRSEAYSWMVGWLDARPAGIVSVGVGEYPLAMAVPRPYCQAATGSLERHDATGTPPLTSVTVESKETVAE